MPAYTPKLFWRKERTTGYCRPSLKVTVLGMLFIKKQRRTSTTLYRYLHACNSDDTKLAKELRDIFAAADIVLSRAGANAISEFLALNKPMLLIPLSKKASRGDQKSSAIFTWEKGTGVIRFIGVSFFWAHDAATSNIAASANSLFMAFSSPYL